MGEVLSQDEVDALLSGLTGGEIPVGAEAPSDDRRYTLFDFMNQDRIVRGRLPTLEMVHERFSRLFRQSISSAMQRIIDVNMVSAEMTKFGEFIRSQPIPSSFHVLRIEPLKGTLLLSLDGKLIFTMVNVFFGGRGASFFKQEGRDFTAIENRLIRSFIEVLLKDYNSAWQPVQKLNITHMRSEVNPQFVSIVPPSDAVWVVEIEMSFEDVAERFHFCLPYSSLEPMKEKLKARYQSESMESENTWADRIAKNLHDIPIEVSARLGTAELTGRQILNLRVGDVIQLDERCDAPLAIFLEGVLKLEGAAGSLKGYKAVRIRNRTDRERGRRWLTK
ncbi:flagellar motor switch protein FliM [Candidatus Sumerlaeota bacterium]|nr:flagellar motor switch protein FliM [Candidatus Sumerlaeota bacterium]